MTRLAKIAPIDAQVAIGERATFTEVASASFQREQLVGELTSGSRFRAELYQPVTDFVQSVTQGDTTISEDMVNRLYEQDFQPDDQTLADLVTEAEALGLPVPDAVRTSAFSERKQEMTESLLSRVSGLDEIIGRGRGVSGLGGQLTGGFIAGFDNIETVATMPIGATSRAGILMTALIEGTVNAATEAGTTPERNRFLRELGLPEESILENAAMGFAVGGTLGGSLRALTQLGQIAGANRANLVKLAAQSDDPEIRALGETVKRDLEDEEAAARPDRDEIREHRDRAEVAAEALHKGEIPNIPDRPTFAVAAHSIVNGEIEEVKPGDLLVQPDVFQFKSDIVAEGGVTEKLINVKQWDPGRAGIVYVYEYADGSRAIADGHQRVALATRISAETGEDIRLAAKVWREIDGYTAEDIRVEAALKNISEAADGMTVAMARDAAKVLRISPERIMELPAGPGIIRANALSRLSDDAFDMFINEVVPERFAEIVGRLVDNPDLHAGIMKLLARTEPNTTAQAESIVSQALAAPVHREVTADLFGEQEIVESLFLERAKVLERTMRILKDDRSVFKTLDERAAKIEGTGGNRLDAQTNKETREQVEKALASIKATAHRAGPISEALNDGAKTYKETGRLKDAADRVAAAVRREVERNGLAGAGIRPSGQDAKPSSARTKAPDPLEGFSDPVNGEAVKAQIEATKIEIAEPMVEVLADLDPVDAGDLTGKLKVAQGIRDYDDLMARAARNHGELTDQIAAAAQISGAKQKVAPLKDLERIKEKVEGKYKGDINGITDVARGGIEAPSNEAAEAFVAALGRRYRVVDEGWNFTAEGYFDRKLMVIFDDGMIGEVQIWPPGMLEAKEAGGGHDLYKISRDATQSDKARADAVAKMNELYRSVQDGLPDAWKATLADQAGSEAPRASKNLEKRSSEISGDPSSPRTSEGETGPQSLPVRPSESMVPGSGSTAGTDRSIRKNLMGDTSTPDISQAAGPVKVERTQAGVQGVFDGVDPITERQALQSRMEKPMGKGVRGDDTEIGGLFDPLDPARVDLFDAVPVGVVKDGDELVATVKTRQDLIAELDADDEAADIVDICVRG